MIGASQSGKTTSVLKIIKQKLIEPMPKKIFYLYGARQSFMDQWNTDNPQQKIEFVDRLNLDVVDQFKEPKLLIIDDLILELNKDLAQHFIAGSHHKRVTTIFITHSIYLNNELYRLISNNAQYILLFKNKRNYSQVARLGRQILGSEYERLTEAYKYIGPYEFVLLSFHQLIPDELLVSTNFFGKCLNVFM